MFININIFEKISTLFGEEYYWQYLSTHNSLTCLYLILECLKNYFPIDSHVKII